MKFTYTICQLTSYINWAYFYHAWQVRDDSQRQTLRREAGTLLEQWDGHYQVYALFQLMDAANYGDDILLYNNGRSNVYRLPMLRQQSTDSEHLSLADFVAPAATDGCNKVYTQIGLFATSADESIVLDYTADPYQKMMAQLLADRLAEAAAEKLHKDVRECYWQYAGNEHLTIEQMLAGQYQGIRPAIGYPSLPDTSLNFIIDEILHLGQIGISLTENGAMKPHASVSGLMLAHPQAHYFDVGRIGEDQLNDYAARRGLPVESVRRFLKNVEL
jgi:cobalamin-dependent methionine synthase I